jgi:rod shape-determining protein MreC
MALPDIRERAGYLFLAVAVGHIILISGQVNSRSGIPLLQAVVFGAFSRVQETAAGVVGSGQAIWNNYVDLRHVRAENGDLRRRNAELQAKLQQLHSQVEESGRLRQLLDLQEQSGLVTIGAQVIAGSATPDFRTVTIDKGRRDGLRAYTAVLASAGIVGCVVTPSRGTAKVQLLVDRNAAIAGAIERSRAQGIVLGTGEDLLRMEYLAATADVKQGDVVLSSGIDGIYPKGFAVGRVERVERVGTAVKTAFVRPAVDFSALEEVLVVQGPQQGPPPVPGPQPGLNRTGGGK